MDENSSPNPSPSSVQSSSPLQLIYTGTDTATGHSLAMKQIPLHPDEGIPPPILKEVYYLKTLRSNHTLSLRDAVISPDRLYLILDYEGMTLRELVDHKPNLLDSRIVEQVGFSCLEALAYIHQRKVAHLGLNPDCVIIEDSLRVRLDGFYYAQTETARSKTRPCDHSFNSYSAPELLSNSEKLDSSADMWSFGCLLLVLLTKTLLQSMPDKSQLLQYIKQRFPPSASSCPSAVFEEMVPGISYRAKDLLQKLLCLDPAERPSAQQACAHSYFSEVRQGLPLIED